MLEVGIGDGENLGFLPRTWTVYGVDIARTQLVACRDRYPQMRGRLAWAEAEACPSRMGRSTPATRSAASLTTRIMPRRCADAPGDTSTAGPVVVADETPGMHRAGIGHLIGTAGDRQVLALSARARRGIRRHGVAVRRRSPRADDRVWPDAARRPIWNRLGYCLVHPDPERPGMSLSSDEELSMSTLPEEITAASPWSDHLELLRCPQCAGAAAGSSQLSCGGCDAAFPIHDGILVVKEQTDDNNRVAQEFYDSALWPKFRFWEKFTWCVQWRRAPSANQVLKHLPQQPGLNLLDVAIGDGVYLPWMPADWQVVGIDVSWSQLEACRPRTAGPPVRLIQGEAETLPFQDAQFDAVLSIGSVQLFQRPGRRVAGDGPRGPPGATIVISDEMPNLTDRMIGHKLGLPALDRWIVSRLMHLGDSFTEMVERYRDLDVRAIAGRSSCPKSSITRSGAGSDTCWSGDVPG